MLSNAVYWKNREEPKNFLKFMTHSMSYTQQLTKTMWHTEQNLWKLRLKYCKLAANFENCTNISEGPNKNFTDISFIRNGQQLDAQEFLRLVIIIDHHQQQQQQHGHSSTMGDFIICTFISLASRSTINRAQRAILGWTSCLEHFTGGHNNISVTRNVLSSP